MNTAYSLNSRAFIHTGALFGQQPTPEDIARVIEIYRETLANPHHAHPDLVYQARNWQQAGSPLQ